MPCPPILAVAGRDDDEARVVCLLLLAALTDAQQLHYAASEGCPGCQAIGEAGMCSGCWEPHHVPASRYFGLEQLLDGWSAPRPLTGEDWPVITEALADAVAYRQGRDDMHSRALLAAYRELGARV
jgi:hypothetical protein